VYVGVEGSAVGTADGIADTGPVRAHKRDDRAETFVKSNRVTPVMALPSSENPPGYVRHSQRVNLKNAPRNYRTLRK
jgi:hypothetical protein